MYGEKEKRILESMHQLGVIESLPVVRYIHKSNEEQVKLTDVVVLSIYGSVAQLVEQGTENPCVAGSIPAGATSLNIIVLIIEMLSPGRMGATSFPQCR